MTELPDLTPRRAVEALRCGVPNRDAVKSLGCSQPEIEERFRLQIKRAKESISSETMVQGTLVKGEFGSGKSHLLEYLQHVALQENFVCSKVVISKETPLFDPAKLYRAAIDSAVVPGRRGGALTEIASKLNFNSSRYADLFLWINQGAGAQLNKLFSATLFLFERMPNDPELNKKIIRFWSGSRISVSEVKRNLRLCREAVTYKIDKTPPPKDLAIQRFKFASRLMSAAGYAGWVLLIDEVELVSRYSAGQRAKSYAEIARWMGKLEHEPIPGLTSVLAITSDFDAAVLEGKPLDIERIPNKLRAKGGAPEMLLASEAELGMRLIQKESILLRTPNDSDRRATHDQLAGIYQEAYKWEPPPADLSRVTTSSRMREHIKGWITEWDLGRLDKTYSPDIEVKPLEPIYDEDPLQTASEGESADDED